MRKVSVVILIALFTIVNTANAQFLKFGLKAGITSSNVKFDSKTVSTSDGVKDFLIKQGDAKTGYQFGLYARVKALGIFVQPELLFSHSQNDVIIVDQSTSKIYTEAQKFNKIDIPVIVGWKIGPARLGLGPVASFKLSDTDGLKDKLNQLANETTKNNLSNATFGYQVGVGLDILKLSLDVRYEGNLSKFGKGVEIGGKSYSFDQRNPQWIFSLGWAF